MIERDALCAYLAWFFAQPEAFRFDADDPAADRLPRPCAVVIPFSRARPSRQRT